MTLKKNYETGNHLLDEIKHLTSEKHKIVCRDLNYFEHYLLFISPVTGCLSISGFVSLISTPVSITNFFIKKYKSIIKKKCDKIVLLGKAKLDTIEGFNQCVY